MTTHDPSEDPIDAYITSYLLHLDGDGPRPILADLPAGDRDEARARAHLLDVAQGTLPADDSLERIASQFGFDRAGTRITVSGAKFKAARSRAQLDLKTVAARAAAAGAPVRSGDLFKIETGSSTPVDQEVLSVLVAVLDVTVADLEDDSNAEVSAAQAFLASDRFDAVLAEWLAEHDEDAGEVRRKVTDGVLAASYRADDVTEANLVELVQAILRSLER